VSSSLGYIARPYPKKNQKTKQQQNEEEKQIHPVPAV
jgi:hypothetical protein